MTEPTLVAPRLGLGGVPAVLLLARRSHRALESLAVMCFYLASQPVLQNKLHDLAAGG